LPGAVALQRDGQVDVETVGEAARDTIFRVASITKPVAAAAAMLLSTRPSRARRLGQMAGPTPTPLMRDFWRYSAAR